MTLLRRFPYHIHVRLALASMFALSTIAFTNAAKGDVFEFLITLDGSQTVPPVDTSGFGEGMAILDTKSNEFSWKISFDRLKGKQIAAHFHGPAPLCEDAGIQIALPLESPIIGSTFLTDRQVEEVMSQLWYVNIHTDLHPAGEIRGQVMHAPIQDPIPDPIPRGEVTIRLRTIASELTAPNWGTHRPGHPEFLMVVDQPGTLWDINRSTGEKRVFLDVSDRLVELGVGGEGTFDERGLLGVAFHPDYLDNGLLYTYTSQPVDGPADFSTMPKGEKPDHQSVVTEWRVPDPENSDSVVDSASDRELLRIDEPQFNHDGGGLDFGLDGMLYISLGDGGAGDDQGVGHGCAGNGNNSQTILGTILRIDPQGNDSENGQYGVPSDNPFFAKGGIPEIFAFGFRNPFRFSFDSKTGDLYVADVGQGAIEEVDLVTSGRTYGWNLKEGTFFFVPNGASRGYVHDVDPGVPSTLTDPIAQYDHDEGIAIIGGFVYRGSRIPQLAGRYVFGDWNQSFFGDNGRLFYLNETNDVVEFRLDGRDELAMSLHGLGRDADGELYVLANLGGIPFGKEGVVMKIVRGLASSLESVEVVTGELLAGDVSDLIESDDRSLRTRSGVGNALHELNLMEMIVTATTAVKAPSTIDLVIESRINEPAGSAQVRLRNWKTNEFEQVALYTIGMNDEVFSIEGIDAANFVSGNGEIELSVKHVVSVLFLISGFESFFDQIEVFVE